MKTPDVNVCTGFNKQFWTSNMTQRVKVLASESDSLTLIFTKVKNRFLQVVL